MHLHRQRDDTRYLRGKLGEAKPWEFTDFEQYHDRGGTTMGDSKAMASSSVSFNRRLQSLSISLSSFSLSLPPSLYSDTY